MAWCLQWSVALVIFLVVMAASGYYVFNKTLEGGQLVTVPDIVELPLGDASMLLAEQGLELGKPIPAEHPTIPKDHIITQRPAAGTVVRTGRKVVPTISMGTESLRTPDLVRRSLKDAEQQIRQGRFRVGSVVRVAHKTPRDTVIAQDPPAGHAIHVRGDIHLLVSAGQQTEKAFMPNIRGLDINEAISLVAPLGLRLVPNEVDYPGARVDVVLDQDPPPNALVYQGQIVTYDVKLSGGVDAPNARHQADVRHQMPFDWYDHDVRVDLVDRFGGRETLQTYPRAYDPASRRSRVKGSRITIRNVSYVGQATVEIYIDGELAESYHMRGGLPPVKSSEEANSGPPGDPTIDQP